MGKGKTNKVGNTNRVAADGGRSAIKPSQVTVNSNYYEAVNGRPRGTGQWAFFQDSARDNIDTAIFISGSYSEAKKRAKEEAARRGWRNIYVGT